MWSACRWTIPGGTTSRTSTISRLSCARISHFFTVYKDLDPDRHSDVKGWADREAALEAIEKARRAVQEQAD
jgi:inorganic pyrophosphatase